MRILLLIITFFYASALPAQPGQPLPALLNEATVQYSVVVSGSDAGANETQTKTVSWKGLQMRSDVEGEGFHQSVLVNRKSGEATILREIGNNRFMTPLTAERWARLNDKYRDEKINLTKEQKTIAGYHCRKATIAYKSGLTAIVWYLPETKPSITENDFQFAPVPGLVMEYESYNPGTKQTLRFTALNLETLPVPQSVFEPSLAGYRLLN